MSESSEEMNCISKSFQTVCEGCTEDSLALITRNKRIFEEVENAGSEISYRCVKCRECKECRKGEKIELISTKEEVEQTLIEKSVHVDLNSNVTEAVLPFTEDPVKKLANNRKIARKVYDAVVRKLNKDPQSKQEVIAFEKKLQDFKMVDRVIDLTTEQQVMIANAPLKHFFPWFAVWNGNSISTPCRMVFHGSMPTETNLSINDILAKGTNNMNKLVEIMIRWFIRRFGIHTDVSKMYNTLKSKDIHWMYQLYLWHDDLDPEKEPFVKVVKTAMYGVKSSGNQASSECVRLHDCRKISIHEFMRLCRTTYMLTIASQVRKHCKKPDKVLTT